MSLHVGVEFAEHLWEGSPGKTERLLLVPRTSSHADAESSGSGLGTILPVTIPGTWPPKLVSPPDSDPAEWSNWYVIHQDAATDSVLIGIAGAARSNSESRTLRIGCSVVSDYHGRRLGEEIVAAL